jgi:hypothetical protein
MLGAVPGSVALTGSRQLVTVNTFAPASCMESLSGCGQHSGRLLSVSKKTNTEMKSVICVRLLYCKPGLGLHVQYVFEIRIYHKYTVYPALLQIH